MPWGCSKLTQTDSVVRSTGIPGVGDQRITSLKHPFSNLSQGAGAPLTAKPPAPILNYPAHGPQSGPGRPRRPAPITP